MKNIIPFLNLMFLFAFSVMAQVPEFDPPPLPQPPAEEKLTIIEEPMPMFPGCYDVDSLDIRRLCTNEKLNAYIEDNLEYPEVALQNKIEGRVMIQFVIEKDGSIAEERILGDIGAGCGKAALAVFTKMRADNITWEFEKEKRPVKVHMVCPVQFVLPE